METLNFFVIFLKKLIVYIKGIFAEQADSLDDQKNVLRIIILVYSVMDHDTVVEFK